jgi:hypothetical protein
MSAAMRTPNGWFDSPGAGNRAIGDARSPLREYQFLVEAPAGRRGDVCRGVHEVLIAACSRSLCFTMRTPTECGFASSQDGRAQACSDMRGLTFRVAGGTAQ